MLYVKLNYPENKVDEVTKFIAEKGTNVVSLVSYSRPGDGLFSKTVIVHHVAAADEMADAIKANLGSYMQK